MERPLFTPPLKVSFTETIIQDGKAEADTNILFEQFFINIDELCNNVKALLRSKAQVPLSELLAHYQPTKGIAEALGYMQIATGDSRHYVNNEQLEQLNVTNTETGKSYFLKAPLIIFNR